MGYRKLLKDYMAHISAIVGGDLVDLAELTGALDRRELGEIRSIAAELKREGFADHEPQDFDHVVRALIEAGEISLQDIAQAEIFDQPNPAASKDEIRAALIDAARRYRQNSDTSEARN